MFKAKDQMSTNLICVKVDTPVYDIVKLLVNENITGVPVVDDDMHLLGVVSEKDLLCLVYEDEGAPKSVEDVMTKNVTTFDVNDSIVDICECLIQNNFRRVPIMSDGKLAGLISRRDIMRFIIKARKN